ncbi:MAG: NAAT family transporter [Deltaproteobacteria bacterium]|jgi:multiple antibiotic resistance protein|nr:NAAT family transporter [Deltaproteobacteria bacterium]
MEETSWTEFSRFTIALLAVLDPLAAIPIFLGLTEGYSLGERRRTAFVTSVAVGTLLVAAALTGEALLTAMGTSLAAFRVGGGIVVLLMALSMLMAQPGPLRQTAAEAEQSASKEAVAVVPLGIPLLAGPGALSTVVIQMDRGSGVIHAGLVVACIALVAALCWIVLRYAELVGRWLGPIGLNVAVRLFGLVLTAIAVEFIVNGLKQMLPILGS